MVKDGYIKIIGARQNNLKGITLNIPFNQIVVITGPSGSGKSSLAFDTLYAEGQRRYIETFSPYTRQFMERMDPPDVDLIENITPSIAIDRKVPVRTSRSTVGTMTEITDYLKLLFPRLGRLFCKRCNREVSPKSPEEIWDIIDRRAEFKEMLIGFSLNLRGRSRVEAIKELIGNGFTRYLFNGEIRFLEDGISDDLEDMDIIVDRIPGSGRKRKRVIDSLEIAYNWGDGRLFILLKRSSNDFDILHFSRHYECANCHIRYARPIPNLFSFNSPIGACEVCRGFGKIIDIDMDLVIPDQSLSLWQGAIRPWGGYKEGREEFYDLVEFCKRRRIPLKRPYRELTDAQKRAIIEGDGEFYGIRGFFEWLETKRYKMHVRVYLSRYRSYVDCPSCGGTRFKKEALLYRLNGLNISEIYSLSIKEAKEFFEEIEIPQQDKASQLVLSEIRLRLQYLCDVGLEYLTLDRQSRTLSGGEVQRVSLTTALGSSLVNTLYVLDEPSIGLHPKDNHRLIQILKKLKENNNTVLVVEHDRDIIQSGDLVLDMGPEAGERGGKVVYFGRVEEIKDTITGLYLRGQRRIPLPQNRRVPNPDRELIIEGASEHNLKDINVRIPLGLFVCITGVSGSGKSTLVEEIIYKGIKRLKGRSEGRPGKFSRIRGIELIEDVVLIDQSPIGKTPRANLLTYSKAMNHIREILSSTKDAKERRLSASDFSFNVSGGRCEYCKGAGFERVEMQFLSDVYIRCPVCKGKRFRQEVLDVRYNGKNIDDILNMTVSEALEFFKGDHFITKHLMPLKIVGLGYLRLGQSINTLSGGEAQRLKLSSYLNSEYRSNCLLIFDEPTTGLHFNDIRLFLDALNRLIDSGNSVLVVEHNLDVIKCADWIIDLGPEGGDEGGWVVAEGRPEDIVKISNSHTGRFLTPYLKEREYLVKEPRKVKRSKSHYTNNRIVIRGAREHNLKGIDVSIPRNSLVVITGVSGSGKSTLAYDILSSEGQRRFLECLAPYVRQYVRILERAEVDHVSGLPPTVSIEQRMGQMSRRSTVATLTEIYHFLRLLFSKLATKNCPKCGRELLKSSEKEIIRYVKDSFGNKEVTVLAPLVIARKGFHKETLRRAYRKGYRWALIDGEKTRIKRDMALERYKEHTIHLIIGKFPGNDPERIIKTALKEGGGRILFKMPDGREKTFNIKGICPICGVGIQEPDPRIFSFNSPHGACPECEGLGVVEDYSGEERTCPVCRGSRLKESVLRMKISGYSIWDMVNRDVNSLQALIHNLNYPSEYEDVVRPIIKEIDMRCELMKRLGLSYLELSRSGDTLSGGEAQRIRLSAQLGSNLTGVCYILDEPTIGLHPRDHSLLLQCLKELRDRGNTILVVEHDEKTIKEADHIIDLGPGPGEKGGRVVAEGTVKDIENSPESVTGLYLKERDRKISSRLRPYRERPYVKVLGAKEHNLKGIDVEFPLNTFICVTGVSGSGKSTLLKDTLYKGLLKRINKRDDIEAGRCRDIVGWQNIRRVLEVDHSPIGKTPRSVPASYIGILGHIRELFSKTPSSRARGYSSGRFSFNVEGGRCPYCQGHGFLKVKMSFLPDVYLKCESCEGKRFNSETLDIKFKGKNISEVLDMTFDEALDLFSTIPYLRKAISLVCDMGLGYLRLGQPSPTLSGGEAQRIKIAKELIRPSSGHTFYILDEPTTGLHMADIEKLLAVLQRLVDRGNTVAVIEHNLDVIKEADYIIDLGPESGEGGGRVVAKGSPYELIYKQNSSYTAKYLRDYVKEG